MFGLAQQWADMGHDVIVFTVTPGEDFYSFPVIRTLSPWRLLAEVSKSDIFFEANISLKTWWIGILNLKKWFVLHHLTYTHIQRWQEVLKNQLTLLSNNISASRYIAGTLKGKSAVIPNFFSANFVRIDAIQKNRDVVFVGRLVSDKGVDDLINALTILKDSGSIITCAIVGDGPEKEKLVGIIHNSGLEKYITFKGPLQGEPLVREINAHKVMVVPSKWPEPFGVVVLEGLACGCRIVCSSDGGLPESASDFGLLYPNHDVNTLAKQIKMALEAGAYSESELRAIQAYLKTRTSGAIAKRYIDFFSSAISKN